MRQSTKTPGRLSVRKVPRHGTEVDAPCNSSVSALDSPDGLYSYVLTLSQGELSELGEAIEKLRQIHGYPVSASNTEIILGALRRQVQLAT